MSEAPSSTVQTATHARPDVDIEPSAEMQPAPRPVPGRVVRDLPQQSATPQVEKSSIVQHSEEHIGDVFAALAAAQGEFGDIERTLRAKIKSDRADYSYDYAPLDEVLQAVRPALSKNKLSIMQFPFAVNGAVTIRTLLGHASGGWFFNDLRVTTEGNDPRSTGSAITYARRYALMSMLGVAPSVDDDGGAAQPKADPPRPGERRPAQTQEAGPQSGPSRQPAPPAPAAARPAAPSAAAPAPAPAAALAAAPAAEKAKPAGRAKAPVKPAGGASQAAAPQQTPAAPPPASQPVAEPPAAEDASTPAPVGRIVEMQEKPNGCLVTLETGFRAASKDVETTKALKVYKGMTNAVVKLTTRPSSDPTRYAPVIAKVDLVQRDREPGEEG